jgi:hypothetical protein
MLVARTCLEMSSRMMSLVFFGERLCKYRFLTVKTKSNSKLASNDSFSASLLQYSRDMVNCMMAFQVVPKFSSPYVLSSSRTTFM